MTSMYCSNAIAKDSLKLYFASGVIVAQIQEVLNDAVVEIQASTQYSKLQVGVPTHSLAAS